MRPRAKPKTAPAETTKPEEPQARPAADQNPPRLFILNQRIGKDASIITLAHPRTLKPTQYYMCPTTGLYEIRCSQVDPDLKRSVLLDSFGSTSSNLDAGAETPATSGYVLEDATTHSVTPIDPVFLLLPALKLATSSKSDSEKGHFRSADDILETLFEQSKHLSRLAGSPIRPLLEQRMAAVCDTVEAGDDMMYRLSEQKLLAEVLEKARRVSKDGLPLSMEDKFVTRPLEIPIYAVSRQFSKAEPRKTSTQEDTFVTEQTDSQSSVGTTYSADSFESQESTDTAITVPDSQGQDPKVPDDVTQLQRLRIAVNMVLSLYVPEHIAANLRSRLPSADCGVDFSPLDKHLEFLAKAKADAAASRSLGDFTRKRGFDHDEAVADRAEKKRKTEEEEKRRKAGESRGVRDLKKVNIGGMKKMSDFFKKTAAK